MSDTDNKIEIKSVDRYIEMDIAKGLAIILVVWGHVLFNTTGHQSIYIEYVHMPVFYFISGFFLFAELKKYSYGELTIKKISRLIIPYFVWSGVAFLANIFMSYMGSKDDFSGTKILNELKEVFLYSRSVWFFLQLFFAIELIVIGYYLRTRLSLDKKPYVIYALLCIAYVALVLLPVDGLMAHYKFKWLFLFMLIGLFYRENENVFSKIKNIGICLGIVLLGVFIYSIVGNGFYGIKYVDGFYRLSINGLNSEILFDCLKQFSIGLCGLFVIFTLSLAIEQIGMLKKFFVFIGTYSLDIYVIHMFLLYVIKAILVVNFSEVGWILITLAISVILSVGIAFGVKIIFRKFKIYRIMTGTK